MMLLIAAHDSHQDVDRDLLLVLLPQWLSPLLLLLCCAGVKLSRGFSGYSFICGWGLRVCWVRGQVMKCALVCRPGLTSLYKSFYKRLKLLRAVRKVLPFVVVSMYLWIEGLSAFHSFSFAREMVGNKRDYLMWWFTFLYVLWKTFFKIACDVKVTITNHNNILYYHIIPVPISCTHFCLSEYEGIS